MRLPYALKGNGDFSAKPSTIAPGGVIVLHLLIPASIRYVVHRTQFGCVAGGVRDMGLEERVAVIAGASGGLGRVVTQTLAERGMRVAMLGSDAERLETLAGELKLQASEYSTHALRLEEREGVFACARAVYEKFGRADALLNFVGGWVGGKELVDIAPDDFATMLSQHAWTTFHLAQAFVPHMIRNGWGRIATVSAPNTFQPQPKRAVYAAAKAAQEALILGLAQELVGTGVTANVLVVRAIDAKHEREKNPTPKNAGWTTPEELTGALLYLLTDEGGVVNGQRLALYGG
jgi:3-oxoacyl-[acyl-carrier protein] reductase